MIDDSLYEKTITHMLSCGMLSLGDSHIYQDMLVSEFKYFVSLYESKNKTRLYEILRSNSNEFFRILFSLHHNIPTDKLRSDLIRDILRSMSEEGSPPLS